ncbi:uncharacterized protein LOC132799164 [Ziziphus jujuba]|uniref:Uncharacterized protein LOC132799164 n=1 Tax=Ziziphus jujuba TaxID=326968 RepID=A0ABM3IRE4_ZIZJJ|nr:uncharacterized protein LOC132799164 [Ziziphus jujuba]
MENTHYHASHPEHPLELKSHHEPAYKCDGCKETGFGKRYRCDLCDFDLHKDCMFLTNKTSHAFFKGSTFEFFEQPPRQNKRCNNCKRYCDACGKQIKGFVYHCQKNDLDLHPCCSNLKEVLKIDGKEFRLSERVDSSCFWCGKVKVQGSFSGARGWSYVSMCNEYHLHVHCATEMVSEVWKNKDKLGNDNNNNNNDCLDLENLKLPKDLAKLRKDGARGNKYWRIIKTILRTIACILMGEPTITMTCLVVELLT